MTENNTASGPAEKFPHAPQYNDDSTDTNTIGNVTEFNNDVYVYGKLYADLVGGLTGDGGALEIDSLIAVSYTHLTLPTKA